MSFMAFSRGPFRALEKKDGATFRDNPFQWALKCRPKISSVQSRHSRGTEFAQTWSENHNLDSLFESGVGPESKSKSRFDIFCSK
jgi:hypothetical protein